MAAIEYSGGTLFPPISIYPFPNYPYVGHRGSVLDFTPSLTFRTDPRFATARALLAMTELPDEDARIAKASSARGMKEVLGEYLPRTDELWVHDTTEPFSAIHEYGHVIWYHATPYVGAKINHVLEALRTTPEFRRLAYGFDLQAYYARDGAEMWARSVAQYVATLPDQNPEIVQQWHDYLNKYEWVRDMQWTDESFVLAHVAFDEAFPRDRETVGVLSGS